MHDCQVYLGLCCIHQTGATRLENALKLRPVGFLASLKVPQDVHLSPYSAQSDTSCMKKNRHSTTDTLAMLCALLRHLGILYSSNSW